MPNRLTGFVGSLIASIVLSYVPGCASAGASKPADRASSQARQYTSPGLVGGNAATDRRRTLFDSQNEQIVREGIRVSTVVIGGSNMQRWNLAEYFTPEDGAIENRGIGGEPVWHTARRFDADVVQLRPRNVVIHIPLNGISGMIKEGKTKEEISRTLADSVATMMKAGRAAGINVFVFSAIPTNDRYRNHEAVAPIEVLVDEKVKAACAATGCIYVDIAAALSDTDGNLRKDLTRDGLHVNAEGYAIMASVLKAAAQAHGLRL